MRYQPKVPEEKFKYKKWDVYQSQKDDTEEFDDTEEDFDDNNTSEDL